MVDETPRGRGPRRRQRSEGFEADGDPQLEDDDLNDTVVDSIPANEPLSEVDSDRVEDFTPRNRMRDVAESSRSTQYQQEYRLKLVHRMLMRGIPLDQIAADQVLKVGLARRQTILDRLERRLECQRCQRIAPVQPGRHRHGRFRRGRDPGSSGSQHE